MASLSAASDGKIEGVQTSPCFHCDCSSHFSTELLQKPLRQPGLAGSLACCMDQAVG